MDKEFETVAYTKLKHVRVFVNNIIYRNYHLHADTEILCVLNGFCRVSLAGKSIEAKAGDALLINPYESHEIVGGGEGTDFVILQFSRHFLRDYFPAVETSYFSENNITAALKDDAEQFRKLTLRLAKSYIEAKDNFELNCIADAAAIMALLFEHVPHTVCSEVEYIDRKKAVARTERLASYIDENYRYGISLSALAEKEKLTPTYLSHFFVDRFGVTFREYVNNIRFENALRLMSTPKLSLIEIAMQSGFSDVKYMTRTFVARFGCTPNEYRKNKLSPKDKKTALAVSGLEREYGRDDGLRLLRDACKTATA